MNKMIWKLIAVFALSNLFSVTFIVVTNVMPPLPTLEGITGRTLTNHVAAAQLSSEEVQGGGADMLPASGQTMVLGADATVSFRDAPCGALLADRTLATGSMVEMIGKQMACGHLWYLVRQANGTSGWLSCGLLASPDAPCFAESRFCSESACGSTLSLFSEELWFFASLSGVEQGDLVQYVLIVNEERYQHPPLLWTAEARGQQQIRLFDFEPRLEPGQWSIQLFVNGEFVGEAEVEIQRPVLVGRPEA